MGEATENQCCASKVFNSNFMKVFGDCMAVDEYLNKNNGYCWLIPKFVNCLTRGISQIAFANNPFTGTLVLLTLFSVNQTVGIGALIGASTSVLTAMALGLDKSLISSGLTTYNGALVGIITTSLLPPLYAMPISFFVWMFIVLGACLSVIMNSCIDNLLSSPKNLLPPLTITFNVIQLLMFTCLKPYSSNVHEHEFINDVAINEEFLIINNSTTMHNSSDIEKSFEFSKFAIGVVKSVGQTHGINNLWASLGIMLSISIYSPIHLITGFLGAGLSSFCGIILSVGEYNDVYEGLWGYNGFLASVAIGSIFFLPGIQSWTITMVNIISAAIVQRACQLGFKTLDLPYLTVPYVLTTLIFLQAKLQHGKLRRVKNISYPEKHLYEYYIQTKKDQQSKLAKDQDQEMSCVACRSTSDGDNENNNDC